MHSSFPYLQMPYKSERKATCHTSINRPENIILNDVWHQALMIFKGQLLWNDFLHCRATIQIIPGSTVLACPGRAGQGCQGRVLEPVVGLLRAQCSALWGHSPCCRSVTLLLEWPHLRVPCLSLGSGPQTFVYALLHSHPGAWVRLPCPDPGSLRSHLAVSH